MVMDEVAVFLRFVGTGDMAGVRATLAALPELVNAVGPHPFFGGRPQALHVAIEAGHREIFDLLVEAGAEVGGRNDQYKGWSPLMLAIQRGREEMRDELMRRGAPVGLVEALMLGLMGAPGSCWGRANRRCRRTCPAEGRSSASLGPRTRSTG